MHEENRVSQSYNTLFPGSSAPKPHTSAAPEFSSNLHTCERPLPNQPCQSSPMSHHCQTLYSCHCHSFARPSNCHQAISKPVDVNARIEKLNDSIDKLQGELVDVVDKLEKLSDHIKRNELRNQTTSAKPLFRNPHEIPELNRMETVLDVEVATANETANESLVSVEEFVPDIILHPSPPKKTQTLNSQHLTIQFQ